jgi:predicted ester cyclase
MDPKETYRRIIDAVNRGDPDALDDPMAPDIVDHNPIPDQKPGREGFKQWMAGAKESLPDLFGTIEDLIAEGDLVAARVRWQGTHRGEWLGIRPTNRRVSFSAFHQVRFSKGRAVEWWGTADLLGALRQLGASVAPSD